MAEEIKPGEADPKTGGAGEETPPEKTPEQTPVQVSVEAYNQIKKDMLKYKDERNTLQSEKKHLVEEKLTNEKNWEELAKARAEERDVAIKKADDLQKSVVDSKKYDAVKNECIKLGIKPEALEDLRLLGMDEVQTELTTLGNINIHGQVVFAERLKTLRPHWFGQKNPPNLNTNTPGIVPSDGTVTGQELALAEREGRKKGDMSAYRALMSKYMDQQKAAG